MAYEDPEIRTFRGLYKQRNSFNVPDGALETAKNVVIVDDDIIAKRRGFYQFINPSSAVNAIFNYQDRLVMIHSDKSSYLTETGSAPSETATETVHTGDAVTVTSPRVSRSVQANKNLYFTTDEGVRKLESFDGKVSGSGVPPAGDLRGTFLTGNGTFQGNSQVGWRIVFGRRDSNDNLLLGAPSDILILANNLVEAAGYSYADPLITVTKVGHGLVTGQIITVSNASQTDKNGTYSVTVVDPDTFTYSIVGASASGAGNTLDYQTDKKVLLEFSIPDEIDDVADNWFVQIYRSTPSNEDSATPNPDFKLVSERNITAAEITANVAFFTDELPNELLGAELYTNPNSREGELQSNQRAPFAEDLEEYKKHVLYSNVKTRHVINLSVIAPSNLVSGDFIEVNVDATTRKYIAREGLGNKTTTVESVAVSDPTITLTVTAHGLSNGDIVLVSRTVGTLVPGEYTVSGVTVNTFDITSAGVTATDLDVQGVRDSAGDFIFHLDKSSGSVSVQLRETAQGLVKAINRDTTNLAVARYTSGIVDVPGQLRLQAKGFTGNIRLRANTTTAGDTFSPTLTTDFADTVSDNDEKVNVFFASKTLEPEAVPLVNFFAVGSEDKKIFRSIALRDSTLILKEDGVFRLNGDNPSNFSITVLDNTIFCISDRLVDVINNQVIFMSNQGVCLATENSVQIVSRKIEDVIQPILTKSALPTVGGAVSYESERLWLLSTIEPNTDDVSTTYVYNIINDSWTTWDDVLFKNGVIGPNDKLYLIGTDNLVVKERKNGTKIDYCGQNYPSTINTVSSDGTTAEIEVTGAAPVPGDVFVINDVFTRIDSASLVSGDNYDVVFSQPSPLEAGEMPVFYKGYESIIKLSPFHGGKVGKLKQFSQMQVHLRQSNASRFFITYAGAYLRTSTETDWRRFLLPAGGGSGWGFEPWGFFPWGNVDAIEISFGTQPSAVVRDYIPRVAARDTFIQPILKHIEAGELITIQAISFSVRANLERLTK